jgi:thiamine pyrophosphokinase
LKGLVITGGSGPDRKRLTKAAEEATRIVAADSGLERALESGIEPDVVVGDMDSLEDRGLLDHFPAERVRSYPQDKDDTDTEIALNMLYESGAEEIVLAGGGGGRLDHLIGILSLFHRNKHPDMWLTGENEVTAIDDVLVRTGLRGEVVSLFPVGTEPAQMRSAGLKWPLDGLTWRAGDVGISNVVVAEELRVQMLRGRLIMVRSVERQS